MRRSLIFACALAALSLAPAAQADLRVGVADDHPKISPELAGRFYDTMADVGLTENRITVQWDSTHPTTIPNLSNNPTPGRIGSNLQLLSDANRHAACIVEISQQDDKLVAAKTRHGIGAPAPVQ